MMSENDSAIIEYYKCTNDFIYFVNNYVIDFTTSLPTQINLYVPQIEIVNAINKYKHVVLLGSRQVGKTILIESYIAWLILFHPGYNVSVLSRKAEFTCKIIYEIRRLLECLKQPFTVNFENRQQVEKSLESKLRLANKSEIQAITVPRQNPEEAGRGNRSGFIFIDEAAHITELPKIMSGLMHTTNRVFVRYKKQNLPYGIVIASTPNGTTGTGKYFYDLWNNSKLGQNGFVPIRFHWTQVPEFNQEWYNEQCRKHPQRDIDQELDLKFLPPEDSFLSETIISKLQDGLNKDDVYKKIYIEDLELHIYEENKEEYSYIMGVDAATQHGPEFSAINILCHQTGETVLEYIGKCSITTLCRCINELVKFYPKICIVVEANGVGNQVVEYCLNKEELKKRLFYVIKKKEIKYGLTSDSQVRNQILSNIYSVASETPNLIRSEKLKLQLIGLRSRYGRVEGNPDDLVFAYGLALYVNNNALHTLLNIYRRIGVNISSNSNIQSIYSLHNQRYDQNKDDNLNLLLSNNEDNNNNNNNIIFNVNNKITDDFSIFTKLFLNTEKK